MKYVLEIKEEAVFDIIERRLEGFLNRRDCVVCQNLYKIHLSKIHLKLKNPHQYG